jgi:hypothetical protein
MVYVRGEADGSVHGHLVVDGVKREFRAPPGSDAIELSNLLVRVVADTGRRTDLDAVLDEFNLTREELEAEDAD